MNARLSVWTSYYIDLGPEDAVHELKKHGINAAELSDEHGYMLLQRGDPEKVGSEFRKFAEREGVEISQGHLWLSCRICDEGAVETLGDWLVLYNAIGIKNAVLHCDSIAGRPELTMNERYALNLQALKKIQDIAEGLDIRICLENLTRICLNAGDINGLIDELDESRFGICLDTGHLNLCEGSQRDFVLSAGSRLHALHIADNEGKTDQHMMPFGKGNVDFAQVVDALREVDYDGLFNYEIPGERLAPLEIRGYKLEYIRKCFDYMMK